MAFVGLQLTSKYDGANIVAKIKNLLGTTIDTIPLIDRGEYFFSEEITNAIDPGTYLVAFLDIDNEEVVGTGELYWDGDNEIDTSLLDTIRKALLNNMKVDKDTNKLIIYDDDGTTELFTYDLYDLDGSSTNDTIFRIDNA